MIPALIIIIFLLIGALVAVILIWVKAANLLKKYDAIDDTEAYKSKCENEIQGLRNQAVGLNNEIAATKQKLQKYIAYVGPIKDVADAKNKIEKFRSHLSAMQAELGSLEETASMQEIGFYERKFEFDHPDEYKHRMSEVVQKQKLMAKNGDACRCDTEWHVEGSAAKGKKMVNEQIKLMLRAFNGECNAAIGKVKHGNVVAIEKRVTKCFEALTKMGATKQITFNSEYLDLKLQELYLTHEYELAKQEEKERQREIKEQIREEQKAEKEIEEAKKKAEKEEQLKGKALADARKQLADEHGKHNEKLESLVAKLENELKDAIDRKAKAIARAQLTRSGHVYVLSNIGTMGEGVFKIGMTRRLEPLERVKELGDASVPFPFDVHAIIYSEDAPALEHALHKVFNDRRVNLVNLRREYFSVSLKEIQDAVADLHGLVSFKLEPDAEQYHETNAIRKDRLSKTA